MANQQATGSQGSINKKFPRKVKISVTFDLPLRIDVSRRKNMYNKVTYHDSGA